MGKKSTQLTARGAVAKKAKTPPTSREARLQAFKRAKTTPEQLGAETIIKARELMDAQKVRIIPGRKDNEGVMQPSTETKIPDVGSQLGATRLAAELADLFSSRTAPGGGKVEVVLVLPGWAQVYGHQLPPASLVPPRGADAERSQTVDGEHSDPEVIDVSADDD